MDQQNHWHGLLFSLRTPCFAARMEIATVKTPSRVVWIAGWAVMAVSATAVALFSFRYALPHVPGPAHLANFTTRRGALCVHAVCAAVALLLGPWQFLAGLRARRLALHRALGRCYALAVLVGWAASLPIALHAQTGPIASAGFLVLGACWMTATATAIWKVTQGDIPGHRRWMTRSYALTTAAITLRIYLLAILGFNIPFVPGYRVIAWACWIPNLLAAEFLIRRAGR
jgi:uncharacterized membrane protein